MISRVSLLIASAAVIASNIASGQVVINEIMRNPTNVISQRNGEWFELFNPTKREVDINGWTIKAGGINRHVISNGGPLIIVPGGYLVLGNNLDFFTNGGVILDYEYNGYIFQSTINNRGGLALLSGSVEVDHVDWNREFNGTSFPNEKGTAMALLDPSFDNTVGSNWCSATTAYDDGNTNRGTPGAANDCPFPTLVINEIMRNPKNVATEREGEWFELFNPTDHAVDINGWVIKDDGSNYHSIRTDNQLIIDSLGYLVLGNNDNFTTNGGVLVDYKYDGTRIFLNNEADELVLMAGSIEIDRVNWDGKSPGNFPNQDGASMSLFDPSLDNNVSSSWCNALTVYGNGDMGTPGADNDCP